MKSAHNGFRIGLDPSYHEHFINNLDETVISHPNWMKTRILAAQSLSVAIQQETNYSHYSMFRYRLQLQRLPYNYSLHLNYTVWYARSWICPFHPEHDHPTKTHWLDPVPDDCNETYQSHDDLCNHLESMSTQGCRFHQIILEFLSLIYPSLQYHNDTWRNEMKELLNDDFKIGW